MPADVNFEPIPPQTANPEVAANTALEVLAAAILVVEEEASGLPPGGDTGEVLAKTSNENGEADWLSLAGKLVPTGGTTGQALVKTSNTNGDTAWATIASGGGEPGAGLPPGGTTGQVLTKQSDTDGDADWETPTGGGSSGGVPLAGPHKFWRLLPTGPVLGGRTDYANIADIEFRPSVGATKNVILAPGSSGAFDPANAGADKAHDGIVGTRWESNAGFIPSGNIWIGAEFSSNVFVGEIFLTKALTNPELNINAFNVEFSEDGVTWTVALSTQTGFVNNTSPQTVAIALPTTAETTYIEEAPIDNNFYVRRNGEWVILPLSGGGGEAVTDPVIQRAYGAGGTASAVTVTMPNPTTVGSSLVCFMLIDASSPPSPANGWTLVKAIPSDANSRHVGGIYRKEVTAAGTAIALPLTTGGNFACNAAVMEIKAAVGSLATAIAGSEAIGAATGTVINPDAFTPSSTELFMEYLSHRPTSVAATAVSPGVTELFRGNTNRTIVYGEKTNTSAFDPAPTFDTVTADRQYAYLSLRVKLA